MKYFPKIFWSMKYFPNNVKITKSFLKQRIFSLEYWFVVNENQTLNFTNLLWANERHKNTLASVIDYNTIPSVFNL